MLLDCVYILEHHPNLFLANFWALNCVGNFTGLNLFEPELVLNLWSSPRFRHLPELNQVHRNPQRTRPNWTLATLSRWGKTPWLPSYTYPWVPTSIQSMPGSMDKGVCASGCGRWCKWARLDVTEGHRAVWYPESGGLSAAQVPSKQDSLDHSLWQH